ncbi:unnamed protein product [Rotaria magnacalcarata]|uniref:CCHC-type domain-containing protein n=1 Tax=Rotaria magnacalcarata TaxID=392030 RepID=A0A816ZV95_9BILA|nr:unnamed protein product [Rotaria magnacalcarata]CAF4150848.1 unnamed protein product [Rotaria magnacalcarata]
MATSYKAPPAFADDMNYESWKKEISIWQAFTELSKARQGPAIFLSLTGKPREAVLELEISEISSDNGVKKLLEKLDSLYLEDKKKLAYLAYDKFENFQRPIDMSINEYIIEFERLYNKVKKYSLDLPDGVLAYRLLKSANVSEQHQQLARATLIDLTYENMKQQLKKIFGGPTNAGIDKNNSIDLGLSAIKVEPVFLESKVKENKFEEDESMYSSFKTQRGNRGSFTGYSHNNSRRGRGNYQSQRRGNPRDKNGKTSQCRICGSIYHWARQCPDKERKVDYATENKNTHEEEVNITLFQNIAALKDIGPTSGNLIDETLGMAILDSGCSRSVCGELWLQCYLDALTDEDKGKVVTVPSKSVFKFGDGERLTSLKRMKLPSEISGVKIFIETDVIDSDIPLLLSRSAMKKANTKLDFTQDSAVMLGKVIPLSCTSSGHYCIPVIPNVGILKKIRK